MLSPFTPRGKQYYPHAVGVQTRDRRMHADAWLVICDVPKILRERDFTASIGLKVQVPIDPTAMSSKSAVCRGRQHF